MPFPRFFWQAKVNPPLHPESPKPPSVNGARKHLDDAPYLLPKDFTDANRLDLQHFMLRLVMHGNYDAPLEDPHNILDVACGTGRWAAELAHQFHNAAVFGVDLIPPNPDSPAVTGINKNGVPLDNLTLLQRDIVKDHLPQEWTGQFDFVHMRLMLLALSQETWMPVVRDLVRVTRPGGYIELADSVIGAEMKTEAWKYYYSLIKTISDQRHLDLGAGIHIGTYLAQAGIPVLGYRLVEVPFGYSAGREGTLMATNAISGIEATRGPLVGLDLISNEKFDVLLLEMTKDLYTAEGAVQPFYVAYGRKPQAIRR